MGILYIYAAARTVLSSIPTSAMIVPTGLPCSLWRKNKTTTWGVQATDWRMGGVSATPPGKSKQHEGERERLIYSNLPQIGDCHFVFLICSDGLRILPTEWHESSRYVDIWNLQRASESAWLVAQPPTRSVACAVSPPTWRLMEIRYSNKGVFWQLILASSIIQNIPKWWFVELTCPQECINIYWIHYVY